MTLLRDLSLLWSMLHVIALFLILFGILPVIAICRLLSVYKSID